MVNSNLLQKSATMSGMYSTLGERLKEARAMREMTRTQLSELSRVGYSTIAEIENGGMKSTTKLHALAKALNVPDEWLATGSGPRERMSIAEVPPPSYIAPHETRPGYVRYQQMAAAGGAGPGVQNPDYPEVLREVELAEWQVREKLGRIPSPARVKLLTVRGDSMTPTIRHGDVVFVDLEDRRPEDGCLFAIVLHGLTLVKRLEFRTDGVHIVSLAHPERPDVVPPDEIESLHIAGRVLGAIQLRKAEDL